VDHGVPPLSVPLRNPGELAASDSCTYGDGWEIPGEGEVVGRFQKGPSFPPVLRVGMMVG
jgi:hypothetical protein